MRIVCSWCREEGRAEYVGEKAPLDDARETHGICTFHHHEVQNRWRASLAAGPGGAVGSGLSAAVFQWAGLLNVTKKVRP